MNKNWKLIHTYESKRNYYNVYIYYQRLLGTELYLITTISRCNGDLVYKRFGNYTQMRTIITGIDDIVEITNK